MNKFIKHCHRTIALVSFICCFPASAEVISETSLGDFPGTEGKFTDIGNLAGPVTTVQGSVFGFFDPNLDYFDTFVFHTSGTVSQITVRMTTGGGGDASINLGTGSSPLLINEGGCPDIFKHPRIAPPGEYPLLSSPLAPGTYYIGIRSSINTPVPIEYSVDIEHSGSEQEPPQLPQLDIRVENGMATLSWGATELPWQLFLSGEDLTGGTPVETAPVVIDGHNRVQVPITQAQGFFHLRLGG